MAFTFPSSPSLGQRFTPVGGPTYIWTGTTWDATGAAIDLTPYWQNGSTSLQLDGTTSGTTTLQASAVAGTNTATFPARTGNVMGDGPAFFAQAATATILPTATTTLVTIDSEKFDTGNCYDGLNKFTPNVPGYYQVNWIVTINQNSGSNASIATFQSSLWKNGVGTGISYAGTQLSYPNTTAPTTPSSTSSVIVYMNGTTDYLQVACFNGWTSSLNTNVSASVGWTTFSAALVRGA